MQRIFAHKSTSISNVGIYIHIYTRSSQYVYLMQKA